jgi:hypothetical protein
MRIKRNEKICDIPMIKIRDYLKGTSKNSIFDFSEAEVRKNLQKNPDQFFCKIIT